MLKKDEIIQALKNLGLKPADTVMIHSSYKSTGGVEGGIEGLLAALCDYFNDGLLILPTHTWAFTGENFTFNAMTDKTCVGAIPNVFLTVPGVRRSLHVTHSLGAYGADAEAFLAGEENLTTPFPRESCHGRLYDRDAKIMFLGVSATHNTYIHAVEQWFDVPGRVDENATPIRLISETVNKTVYMHRHTEAAGIACENYDRVVPLLRQSGQLNEGKLGRADCIVMDSVQLYELCGKLLTENIDYFTV